MKKVLLVLFLFWPWKVLAHNFQLQNTNYAICDEEENVYPVHYLTYNNSPVYFLNLNNNYNYALGTYHEYDEWEDDYYINQYLWLEPVINYQTYYDYHMQFLTRLLWEDLYFQKNFYFCGEEDDILERKEREYVQVKNRVNKIFTGIDLFNEDHLQYQGESVTYEDDLLRFYYLVNDGGLDVIMDNDTITVNGDVGDYFLTFEYVDNYRGEEKTFTDGKNKLATVHHPFLDVFDMHITIIEPEKIEEENKNVIEDSQIDFEETKEKEVYININDETENVISFVAKNTFVSFMS